MLSGLNQPITKIIMLGFMIVIIKLNFCVATFSDLIHVGVFLPFKKQAVKVEIRLLLFIRLLVCLCLLLIIEILSIN